MNSIMALNSSTCVSIDIHLCLWICCRSNCGRSCHAMVGLVRRTVQLFFFVFFKVHKYAFFCRYTDISFRFVFLIGASVVLAFKSILRKGVSRGELLRKITRRTVVQLMLGFCFINYSPRDGPRTCKIYSIAWNQHIICGCPCFTLGEMIKTHALACLIICPHYTY